MVPSSYHRMPELDSTDVTTLRLLLADACHSFRDIVNEVYLSTPTVSHRVERLRDSGIVQ